jgi:hypothetical protein
MTEAEWLTCKDPAAMLRHVDTTASERKLRLFAVACCRRIWDLLRPKRLRRAVKVAERHAEGRASASEMALAYWGLRDRFDPASNAARWVAADRETEAASQTMEWTVLTVAVTSKEDHSPRQSELLRCIFGNPFSSSSISRSILTWNNATVVRLAQAIYDERFLPEGTLDNTRLAILADALEEAGCTNADILNHCRQPGEHVRGCWVIDLILGKE